MGKENGAIDGLFDGLFDCLTVRWTLTLSLKAFVITITRKDSQMSCRCNKSGRCTNYVCVKSSKKCSSCLPKRLGNCRNQVGTSFGPTKSVPCPTDVDSQSQAERVTAEIRLLTGLPTTASRNTTESHHRRKITITCTRPTTSLRACPTDQFYLGKSNGQRSINHPQQHL